MAVAVVAVVEEVEQDSHKDRRLLRFCASSLAAEPRCCHADGADDVDVVVAVAGDADDVDAAAAGDGVAAAADR